MKNSILILSMMIGLVSNNAFAAKAKEKKESKESTEGKATLKSSIDMIPYKLFINTKDLKKNNKVNNQIVVKNNGSKGKFKLVFKDYNVDKFGNMILADYKVNKKNEKIGLYSFIKFDSTPFELDRDESKAIPFTVELPVDSVGTKYAHYTVEEVREINFIERDLSKKEKQTSLGMVLKVVGLLVVDIVDTGKKNVKFTHQYIPKSGRHSLLVENIGDHLISNVGVSYVVLDDKNQMVERVKMNTAKDSPINPSQVKIFGTTASKKYKKGTYSILFSLTGDSGNYIYSEKNTFSVDLK